MRAAFRLRSPHDRAVAALAVPALGSLVADPLLSLVDTAFVGRVGSDALAGLGVSAAVFAVAFFVFNFLEYGTTTEVAGAVGAGDHRAAGRATITSALLAGGAGAVIGLLLVLFAGPVTGIMGATGAVRAEAVTYVMIRALAAPAVLLVRAAHGAYRGHQDTTTPFLVTLVINAVNLVLDPLLIFGADMGVAGAAWATVTAQWVGAAIFIGLFARGRERYGLSGARPVPSEVLSFLRIGRDLAIRSGALLATFTVATAVATRVSAEAVAAHQILSQLFLFLALAVDALAIAAQALVGRHLGAGRRDVALEVSDRLLALGIVIGLALAALLAAAEPLLGRLFTDDPAVLAAMAGAYWLLVLIQPIGAIVFVWDGVFIGAGDFGFLAAAMMASSAVTLALLGLVLPMGWGLEGVWWSIVALMVVRVLTLGWRRAGGRSPLHRRRVPGPSSPAGA